MPFRKKDTNKTAARKRNGGNNGSSSTQHRRNASTSRLNMRANGTRRAPSHPSYYGKDAAHVATDQSWVEKERERSGRQITRRFAYIIAFAVLILVIFVMSVVAMTTSNSAAQQQSISASDTYAVSSNTLNEMENACKKFATALIASSYVNDEETATNLRVSAMILVAPDSATYDDIAALPLGKGNIDPSNLSVDITAIKMTNGGKAYANTYVYTLHATAVDKSDGNAKYVDPGYDMTLYLGQGTDENGNSMWVIKQAEIDESGISTD